MIDLHFNHKFKKLSEPEKLVASCFLSGMSIEKTADYLCRSPKTVEKHRKNIKNKLKLKHLKDLSDL